MSKPVDIIPLFSMASRLENLTRFSMERTSYQESVMSHIGMVALFSMVISLHLEIDVRVALMKAVAHDLDEVSIGDIPRPTKYFSPEVTTALQNASLAGVIKLADMLLKAGFQHQRIINDYESSKNGLPGFVVSLADILAVVHRVWDEVIVRGSRTMIRQAFTCVEQLEDLRDLAEFVDDEEMTEKIYGIIDPAIKLMRKAQKMDTPEIGTMREG